MSIEMPDEVKWLLPIVVGQSWPEGDEDALRRLADAWRAAGDGIEGVTGEANGGAGQSLGGMEGQTHDAFEKLWKDIGNGGEAALPKLQEACGQLGQGCDDAALDVEHTKLTIIASLIALAIQIAAMIASAAFSFGASTAGIPIAQGITRTVVMQIFKQLVLSIAKNVAIEVATSMAIEAAVQGIQIASGERKGLDGGKFKDAAISGAIGGAVGGVFEGVGNVAARKAAGAVGDAAGDAVGDAAGNAASSAGRAAGDAAGGAAGAAGRAAGDAAGAAGESAAQSVGSAALKEGVSGAAQGAIGSVAEQLITEGKVDWSEVGTGAMSGGATGAGMGAGGAALSNHFSAPDVPDVGGSGDGSGSGAGGEPGSSGNSDGDSSASGDGSSSRSGSSAQSDAGDSASSGEGGDASSSTSSGSTDSASGDSDSGSDFGSDSGSSSSRTSIEDMLSGDPSTPDTASDAGDGGRPSSDGGPASSTGDPGSPADSGSRSSAEGSGSATDAGSRASGDGDSGGSRSDGASSSGSSDGPSTRSGAGDSPAASDGGSPRTPDATPSAESGSSSRSAADGDSSGPSSASADGGSGASRADTASTGGSGYGSGYGDSGPTATSEGGSPGPSTPDSSGSGQSGGPGNSGGPGATPGESSSGSGGSAGGTGSMPHSGGDSTRNQPSGPASTTAASNVDAPARPAEPSVAPAPAAPAGTGRADQGATAGGGAMGAPPAGGAPAGAGTPGSGGNRPGSAGNWTGTSGTPGAANRPAGGDGPGTGGRRSDRPLAPSARGTDTPARPDGGHTAAPRHSPGSQQPGGRHTGEIPGQRPSPPRPDGPSTQHPNGPSHAAAPGRPNGPSHAAAPGRPDGPSHATTPGRQDGPGRPQQSAPDTRPPSGQPQGNRAPDAATPGTRPDSTRTPESSPRQQSPDHTGTRPQGADPAPPRSRETAQPDTRNTPTQDSPTTRPDGPDQRPHDSDQRPHDGDRQHQDAEPGTPERQHQLDQAEATRDRTPGGSSYHHDPNMRDLAQRVPDDGVHHTVDVHALPDGRVRVGDHTFSAKEFADMLRRDPAYDGRPIRLLSCDAGTSGLARDLSRELGVPVTAPRGLAWTDGNGRVFASDMGPDGRPGWPPNGSWDTHHPDGTDTPAGNDGFHPSRDGEDPGEAPDDAESRGDEDAARARAEADEDHRRNEWQYSELPDPPSDATFDVAPMDFPDADPQPGQRDSAHVVETIDRSRCEPADPADGPIRTIDGHEVKDYLRAVLRERSANVRDLIEQGELAKNDFAKGGGCLSVGIDRNTGKIYEAYNGRANEAVPLQDRHPVLEQRRQELHRPGGYPQWARGDDAGTQLTRADGTPVMTDYPMNVKDPFQHAEVKILNDILKEHPQASPEQVNAILREVLVDNSFPLWTDPVGMKATPLIERNPDGSRAPTDIDKQGYTVAPCCVNCEHMTRGAAATPGKLNVTPGTPKPEATPEQDG